MVICVLRCLHWCNPLIRYALCRAQACLLYTSKQNKNQQNPQNQQNRQNNGEQR